MPQTRKETKSHHKRILLSFCLLAIVPFSVRGQSFTLICVPDPQHYAFPTNETQYNLYRKQANWIINNTVAYNIKHSVWLGDLTNNNRVNQWTVANKAFNLLDNANIPYSVIPGNHDYCTENSNEWIGVNLRDLTRFNEKLPPSRFASKSWYGGAYKNSTTNNENNYTYFSSSGLDFLLVNLEFAPRKEILTWANNLIAQHPNHRVIISTHSYTGGGGTYNGGPAQSYGGMVGASGKEIFDECASRHSNVFMVVCGHVTESKVNSKTGVNGNRIYEMVVDYQQESPLGGPGGLGNGWLRIMQFNPTTNKIEGSTVTVDPANTQLFNVANSPQFYVTDRYNSNPNHADHKFSLNYNMTNPLASYNYMNPGLTFTTTGVASDLTSNQQKPSIATDSYGNFNVAWAEDNDNNSIFNIFVRNFDSDGNAINNKVRVNSVGVNTTQAVNPVIASAPDGRFVVVWESNNSKELLAKTYNANGSVITSTAVPVYSVTSPGVIKDPSVAMDNSGNWTVTWADDTDGNGTYQIFAKSFTNTGAERHFIKPVNPISAGQQTKPVIAMGPTGNSVIVWQDNRQGTWDIAMRGFNADGTEMFGHSVVNADLTGTQETPDIAMANTGNFVVVWADDPDGDAAFDIRAKGFNASGLERFAERTVNNGTDGDQKSPSVSVDSAGMWYTAWEDNSKTGIGYQMVMNTSAADGVRVSGSEMIVNPGATVNNRFGPSVRKLPKVSVHSSGRPVVVWADDMDGNGKFQALARGFEGTAVALGTAATNGDIVKSPNTAFYKPNTIVTVTAQPNPGYVFAGWTGEISSGSNPMSLSQTIIMTATKKVTANFVPSSSIYDWQLFN